MSEQSPSSIITAVPVWLPTEPPRPAPPLLTAKEAGCYLRLTATHLDDALARIRKRGLRVVQIGPQNLYPLAELERFIERELEENPR